MYIHILWRNIHKMKLGTKILMGIASFALVGGVGVGLSAAMQSPSLQAEALDTGWYLCGVFGGETNWNPVAKNNLTNSSGTVWVKTNLALSVNDQFGIKDQDGNQWQSSWGLEQSSTEASVKAKFYTHGSDAIKCVTAGIYNISFDTSNWHITITESAVSSVDVTKYAVINGVKQGESIGTDTIVEGSTYAVPSRINRTGYHFGGWYTDESCETLYTARTVNADLTLYAKYTTLVADKYIYYVTKAASATNDYIYSFGGDEQFGSWETKKVVDVTGVAEVHGVLSFNGESPVYIYKIPYSSAAEDTHVVLSASDPDSQTEDMALSHQCAYTFDNGVDGTNAHMGAAIEFLLAAETKRNAVKAVPGSILAYSVCGISKTDAIALVSAYTGLSPAAKVYVNKSYTYTYNGAYDGEHTPTETNISYEDIVAQLSAIAAGDGAGVVNASYASNDVIPMVITVMAIGLVVGCGIIILTKKKRA